MDKKQILQDEIINYTMLIESCDYEISNRQLAVTKLDSQYPNDPTMAEYRKELTDKLDYYTTEKKKAQLMLDTLNDQLQSMP